MSLAPRRERVVADVSSLPKLTFGSRNIVWWGTLHFVAIEGFSLVVCAAVYVYLRQNFYSWPPRGTPLPSLGVPTLNVALMLLSLPLVVWTSRQARRLDLVRTRNGLTAMAVVKAVVVALRAWELLRSLNVKWYANAYGSAQWLIVGAHGTLLAVQLVEVVGVAAIFWFGALEWKHFSDADDVAFYWYFVVASWVPLYVLCFLVPRWM